MNWVNYFYTRAMCIEKYIMDRKELEPVVNILVPEFETPITDSALGNIIDIRI